MQTTNLREQVLEEIEQVSDDLGKKNIINVKLNRKAGILEGKIKMADNFDEPLDDFKEYM